MINYSVYYKFYNPTISGRYITLNSILPSIENFPKFIKTEVAGYSELGKEIPLLTFGKGSQKVLMWSQMHGNESTTTKAIFDFLSFVTQTVSFQEEIDKLLKTYSFAIIPILNPDGAALYTRNNANDVDLNRDAQSQSQLESTVLAKIFNEFKPDLCLNMHDQRTIYGLNSNLPATLSFLAPAANEQRSITPSRSKAMELISKMFLDLNGLLNNQIGRYDDSFNSNCVGDTFQMAGVPTILFEAGHYKNDYYRETTREFVFYALLSLFSVINSKNDVENPLEIYNSIPKNNKTFRDVLIENVAIPDTKILQTIALQFEERLVANKINFVPILDAICFNNEYNGHKVINAKGSEILINSQEKIEVGTEVLTIRSKNSNKIIFFSKD